jgi:enoyl-CoA hydratase/carnithine racemase
MTETKAADSPPIVIQTSANGVTILRLNRPAKLNALSRELLDAMQDALDHIAADPGARCVVIEGAGKAFCAGHDLAQMRQANNIERHRELFAACSRVMMSIVHLPVPVIAKAHGIATAAGCQLVASCDLAIASNSAKFAVSGINVGLVTGDFIDAQTAVSIGLINEAVDDSALAAAVAAKVNSILGKDPHSIRLGKAMFHKQRQMELADAYDSAGNVMAQNMMAPDTCEAIDAFVAKRPPKLSFNASK